MNQSLYSIINYIIDIPFVHIAHRIHGREYISCTQCGDFNFPTAVYCWCKSIAVRSLKRSLFRIVRMSLSRGYRFLNTVTASRLSFILLLCFVTHCSFQITFNEAFYGLYAVVIDLFYAWKMVQLFFVSISVINKVQSH